MTEIHIERINATYIKVYCEPHIGKEIMEDFTFFAPGYQFDPRYKKRYWDGKIRLFNSQNHYLYAGLKDKLLEWIKEKEDYETDYEQPCNALNPMQFKAESKFIKSFNLSITPRQYQLDIFHRCLEQGRSTVLSPTGSGKSLIIYMLLKTYGLKSLIIVPTINLVNQMYSDFVSYGMDATKLSKRYADEKSAAGGNNNALFQISTWQSIYDFEPEWFKQFDVVIGDECHGFKAKSLTTIMKQCINAHFRFGFTATLSNNSKVHELMLEGLFGPVIKGESTAELIKQEYLSDVIVNVKVLEYPEKERIKRPYQDEVDFLVNHQERTKYIADLAASLEGSTFVLFTRIQHGRDLHEEISKQRECHLVYGDTEAEQREIVRLFANINTTSVVVASYGIFSLGVNVPNLRNIVFGSPYKSQIKVLQSIGRSLRRTDTEQNAFIYDIADDLSIGSHNNYSIKHFLERIKLYTKEHFPYILKREKL